MLYLNITKHNLYISNIILIHHSTYTYTLVNLYLTQVLPD